MDDIFVGRLMSSPVESVSPETPIEQAARTMLDLDIGSLVVVEDATLVGILTTTDYVQVAADSTDTAAATVSDYMTTDVVTATANDSIVDVAETMVDNGFHHLPVVDDEAGVIGMLTTTDLTAYLSTVESPPVV
ncbi:CBS domain-containing protein [Halohasta litorea]|uniref:CBS domain-containing protein n=1 Tax=Halohasta litorea TaxID=869891 RepID=A0ABD6DAB3_9EURY|nr:CBS domain-containing protein [Halohasta litorea]MEA1932007.1 CBS domain-containing protein [Euryarchaeota archaeon]